MLKHTHSNSETTVAQPSRALMLALLAGVAVNLLFATGAVGQPQPPKRIILTKNLNTWRNSLSARGTVRLIDQGPNTRTAARFLGFAGNGGPAVTERIGGGDKYDWFRFGVQRTTAAPTGRVILVTLTGLSANANVVVVRAGTNSAVLRLSNPGTQSERASRFLSPGYYDVVVFSADNRPTGYRLVFQAVTLRPVPSTPRPRPFTPQPNPRPQPRPQPPIRPVGRISYGGFLYSDHSANTTMSPTTIRPNGTFRISSRSMNFLGSGKVVTVALEVLNRRPGSFGVTRLRVQVLRRTSNSLLVRGPVYAVYGNQSYRVVVVTITNRRPDSYASPGTLKVTQ